MMIKHKTENNMSSSCLTRRSKNKDLCADWMPDQVGHDRKEEQGRSMVEMLGVLAAVGVLSVGGIAGYTYAMNKHYANELLNGASQRAVILKSQKAAGLSLSLREFDGMEVAGGTFGNAKELEDGSAFIIPVSGVKGAVCENLIKATEGTDITIAKDDGETLTDITETDCDDGNDNNLVFVFETGLGGSGSGSGNRDVGVCDNGNVYLSYMDDPCSTDTPDDMECTKNSDCDDGEFCLLASNQSGNDILPHFGNCEPIGAVSVSNGLLSTSEVTYWSWWSAENWCKAQGTRLAKINDIDNLLDYCPKDEEDPDSCEDFLREVFGEVRRFWLGDFNSDGVYRISALSKTAPISPSTQGYSPLCISNQ